MVLAPAVRQICFNDTEKLAHFYGRPVELDDEDRIGGWKVRLDRSLRSLDRQSVHHFHRCRNDARRDDRGDGCSPLTDRIESSEQRLDALGTPENPHDDLGDDGERTLRSDEQGKEVGPGSIGGRRPNVDELPVRQHGFHGEDMVNREART